MTTAIPVPVTTFIGREKELATVVGLLAEHRLVTMTGPGGCGKTRLAIEVVAALGDTRPDRAWVDLAAVADPALVPSAIAGALALQEVVGHDLLDTVAHHVRGRDLLVVLDNCEHLVGACAAAAERLLIVAPSLTVLTTTREPLGIGGEVSYRVPSLSLPIGVPAALDQFEAVRLFIDRATHARPGFAVTNDNAPAVAEICHRLDGIPLAIELAASRVRMMSPQQILDGLADRFRLLTGGSRTALPRQQTLEASVEWSHALLDDGERTLLRRLSAFAGTFTLAAAEAVGGEDDVLARLADLVDKSLVQVDDLDGEVRYRLLETIRLYGRRRLIDAGEERDARRRHAAYYAALGDDVAPRLEGHGMVEALARLDAELDNVRAAHDWAIEHADADTALRVVAGFARYWSLRGHLSEGQRRGEEALALEGGEPRDRSRALIAQAHAEMLLMRFDAEGACGEQAVAIARSLGDDALLARGAGFHADALQWWEPERFLVVNAEATDAARRAGDGFALAWALLVASQFHGFRGDPAHAERLGVEAVAEARRIGDLYLTAAAGQMLATSQLQQGRLDDATASSRMVVAAGRELGERTWQSVALWFLAYVACLRGRHDDARALIDECRVVAGDDPTGLNGAAMAEGWLAVLIGDVADGVRLLEAAADGWGDASVSQAHVIVMLGDGLLAMGDVARARAAVEPVLVMGRQTGWSVVHAGAALTMAGIARHDADHEQAEALARESLGVAAERVVPLVPDVLELLAGLAAEAGADLDAARWLGAADALRQSMGTVRAPTNAARHEADLAHVRIRLGDDGFAEAWTQGASLSPREIVELVQRGRGARRRPATGWASLTPTERQVVPLVAQHLTNAEIGARLFMSPKTVKTHLAHIFAKLGVSSRAELTVAAIRKGLA